MPETATPDTAIIVDSACSLPKTVCDKYNIAFAPLAFNVGGKTTIDQCNDNNALKLFASNQFSRKYKVFTTAPTVKDFERAIAKKLKQGYKQVIVQTVNRTQGDTYVNANAAVARLSEHIAGKGISLKVMDSRTVFAGQGLMAIETIRRLAQESNYDKTRRKMNKLSEKIHTFIIPKSPLIALERSRERNENNVGWGQAMLANTLGIHPIICNANDSSQAVGKVWGFEKAVSILFDHTRSRIDAGLYSPIVTISYAGPLSTLQALPGFTTLHQHAAKKKVRLVCSVASLAAGIYTSVGSLSLAMATDEHQWTG